MNAERDLWEHTNYRKFMIVFGWPCPLAGLKSISLMEIAFIFAKFAQNLQKKTWWPIGD